MALSGITINESRITFMAENKARELCHELNTTEDACGWTYFLRMNARGWYIEIEDEDGNLVGTL